MGFKVKTQQPEARGPGLAVTAVAPGLFGEEKAIELDDGTFVALSVVPRWLPNGAGVDFAGKARLIEADGSAKLCPLGQPIVTTLNFNAGPGLVDELGEDGVDLLAKEVALALLGEPPELTRDVPADGGKKVKVATVDLSPEVKLNCSVRKAKKIAAATGRKDLGEVLAKKAAR